MNKPWMSTGKFVAMADDQVKALDVDQLADYFTDLNADKMEQLNKKIAESASKAEIETMRKEIMETFMKQSAELNESLKTQGLVLAKITRGEKATAKTLKDVLVENKDYIQNSFKERKGGYSIELKTAATMTVATNAGAGTLTEELIPGISIESRNIPDILRVINRGNTSTELKKWVEMVNRDGGATNIGENTTYTLLDFDLVKNSAELKKIAGRVVCVDEILEDIDGIQSTLEGELIASVMNQLASQVISGTGLTVYLKGIDAYSTQFSVAGTILEGAIKTPCYSDVIRAAVAQIRRNKVIGLTTESYARPNAVIVHPDVAAFLDMEKDNDGNYLMVPFKSTNGETVIARCAVIESDDITDADTFYVIDGQRFHLDMSTKHPMRLEWGYGTGDWEDGRITMRLSVRAVTWCRDNEKGAIVKGSFAQGIADMTTPTV